MVRPHVFFPKQSRPGKRASHRLRHYWKQTYLDLNGRLVDIGPANGLTALELYQLNRKRIWVHRLLWLSILAAIPLSLFLALIFRKLTWNSFDSVADIILKYGGVLSSIAMTFLTFGLLIATWRYSKLTALMVAEMREARKYESDPQLSIYLWRRLDKGEDSKDDKEYVSDLIVRNVGKSVAYDVQLEYAHYPLVGEDGSLSESIVSVSLAGSNTPTTLAAGEEKSVALDCSKEQLVAHYKDQKTTWPLITIRLRYRDSYSQIHSITQDYRIDKRTRTLVLHCEFISSPNGYRWRAGRDSLGTWISP